MENLTILPSVSQFRDYCLDHKNEQRVQKFLDYLFDPHQSFPLIIQKHLTTIKSYLTGGESFEEFCKEGEFFL